ncbi:hypothetical protein BaRGS_00011044, partial [Batillaria attramentaria]
ASKIRSNHLHLKPEKPAKPTKKPFLELVPAPSVTNSESDGLSTPRPGLKLVSSIIYIKGFGTKLARSSSRLRTPRVSTVRASTSQPQRLHEEWSSVEQCRAMKRASEMVQHRLDPMYLLSGSNVPLQERYQVNDTELERLREMTETSQMLQHDLRKMDDKQVTLQRYDRQYEPRDPLTLVALENSAEKQAAGRGRRVGRNVMDEVAVFPAVAYIPDSGANDRRVMMATHRKQEKSAVGCCATSAGISMHQNIFDLTQENTYGGHHAASAFRFTDQNSVIFTNFQSLCSAFRQAQRQASATPLSNVYLRGQAAPANMNPPARPQPYESKAVLKAKKKYAEEKYATLLARRSSRKRSRQSQEDAQWRQEATMEVGSVMMWSGSKAYRLVTDSDGCMRIIGSQTSLPETDAKPCVPESDSKPCAVESDSKPFVGESESKPCVLESSSKPFVPEGDSKVCLPESESKACLPVADTQACTPVNDSEVCRQANDSEVCRQANDSEVCRQANDSEVCRQASDSEVCRQANDSEVCKQANDSEVCRQASDAEVCRQANDSEICRQASDAEVCKQANDSEICRQASDCEAYTQSSGSNDYMSDDSSADGFTGSLTSNSNVSFVPTGCRGPPDGRSTSEDLSPDLLCRIPDLFSNADKKSTSNDEISPDMCLQVTPLRSPKQLRRRKPTKDTTEPVTPVQKETEPCEPRRTESGQFQLMFKDYNAEYLESSEEDGEQCAPTRKETEQFEPTTSKAEECRPAEDELQSRSSLSRCSRERVEKWSAMLPSEFQAPSSLAAVGSDLSSDGSYTVLYSAYENRENSPGKLSPTEAPLSRKQSQQTSPVLATNQEDTMSRSKSDGALGSQHEDLLVKILLSDAFKDSRDPRAREGMRSDSSCENGSDSARDKWKNVAYSSASSSSNTSLSLTKSAHHLGDPYYKYARRGGHRRVFRPGHIMLNRADIQAHILGPPDLKASPVVSLSAGNLQDVKSPCVTQSESLDSTQSLRNAVTEDAGGELMKQNKSSSAEDNSSCPVVTSRGEPTALCEQWHEDNVRDDENRITDGETVRADDSAPAKDYTSDVECPAVRAVDTTDAGHLDAQYWYMPRDSYQSCKCSETPAHLIVLRGLPPGYFGSDSSTHGLTSTADRHAQCIQDLGLLDVDVQSDAKLNSGQDKPGLVGDSFTGQKQDLLLSDVKVNSKSMSNKCEGDELIAASDAATQQEDPSQGVPLLDGNPPSEATQKKCEEDERGFTSDTPRREKRLHQDFISSYLKNTSKERMHKDCSGSQAHYTLGTYTNVKGKPISHLRLVASSVELHPNKWVSKFCDRDVNEKTAESTIKKKCVTRRSSSRSGKDDTGKKHAKSARCAQSQPAILPMNEEETSTNCTQSPLSTRDTRLRSARSKLSQSALSVTSSDKKAADGSKEEKAGTCTDQGSHPALPWTAATNVEEEPQTDQDQHSIFVTCTWRENEPNIDAGNGDKPEPSFDGHPNSARATLTCMPGTVKKSARSVLPRAKSARQGKRSVSFFDDPVKTGVLKRPQSAGCTHSHLPWLEHGYQLESEITRPIKSLAVQGKSVESQRDHIDFGTCQCEAEYQRELNDECCQLGKEVTDKLDGMIQKKSRPWSGVFIKRFQSQNEGSDGYFGNLSDYLNCIQYSGGEHAQRDPGLTDGGQDPHPADPVIPESNVMAWSGLPPKGNVRKRRSPRQIPNIHRTNLQLMAPPLEESLRVGQKPVHSKSCTHLGRPLNLSCVANNKQCRQFISQYLPRPEVKGVLGQVPPDFSRVDEALSSSARRSWSEYSVAHQNSLAASSLGPWECLCVRCGNLFCPGGSECGSQDRKVLAARQIPGPPHVTQGRQQPVRMDKSSPGDAAASGPASAHANSSSPHPSPHCVLCEATRGYFKDPLFSPRCGPNSPRLERVLDDLEDLDDCQPQDFQLSENRNTGACEPQYMLPGHASSKYEFKSAQWMKKTPGKSTDRKVKSASNIPSHQKLKGRSEESTGMEKKFNLQGILRAQSVASTSHIAELGAEIRRGPEDTTPEGNTWAADDSVSQDKNPQMVIDISAVLNGRPDQTAVSPSSSFDGEDETQPAFEEKHTSHPWALQPKAELKKGVPKRFLNRRRPLSSARDRVNPTRDSLNDYAVNVTALFNSIQGDPTLSHQTTPCPNHGEGEAGQMSAEQKTAGKKSARGEIKSFCDDMNIYFSAIQANSPPVTPRVEFDGALSGQNMDSPRFRPLRWRRNRAASASLSGRANRGRQVAGCDPCQNQGLPTHVNKQPSMSVHAGISDFLAQTMNDDALAALSSGDIHQGPSQGRKEEPDQMSVAKLMFLASQMDPVTPAQSPRGKQSASSAPIARSARVTYGLVDPILDPIEWLAEQRQMRRLAESMIDWSKTRSRRFSGTDRRPKFGRADSCRMLEGKFPISRPATARYRNTWVAHQQLRTLPLARASDYRIEQLCGDYRKKSLQVVGKTLDPLMMIPEHYTKYPNSVRAFRPDRSKAKRKPQEHRPHNSPNEKPSSAECDAEDLTNQTNEAQTSVSEPAQNTGVMPPSSPISTPDATPRPEQEPETGVENDNIVVTEQQESLAEGEEAENGEVASDDNT